MLPRSVGDMSRHEGSLNALRAAATAVSTSSTLAAYTDAISDSSLGESQLHMPDVGGKRSCVSVRGIDRCYLLSITALHPLVVDKETSRLGILPAIWSSELNGEVRHLSCGTE
jgi:hypothetical protein